MKNKKVNNLTFLSKTAILTLAITLFTLGSYAQDTQSTSNARAKGNIMLSGGILAHYTTQKQHSVGFFTFDVKSTSFTTNITPKVGYFIMDNLAVGLEIGVKTSNDEANIEVFNMKRTINSTAFSVAPFARYYLNNGLFFEGLGGIGTQKTTVSNDGELIGEPTTELDQTTFGFRAGVGYAIELGDHVVLEPTVNYSWENINPKKAHSAYKETLSSIFLGIGFTVFL